MARSQALPDRRGRFGQYGGRFVPELLMSPLDELPDAPTTARARASGSSAACQELLQHWVGRPSPLYHAERLSAELGGAQIWLKREDLLHTGAHKINNTIGQGLLAKEMGKTRVIAETGAGQHGVATAAAAALLGLECTVYMGSEDMRRQRLNVDRMRLLGAEVVAVDSGSRTLKDAINEAMRDWVTDGAHHALHPGLGARPRSLPAHDPRLPEGDRRGGARAAPEAGEARRPRSGDRLRRRRLQLDRHLLGVPRAQEGASGRRRGRRLGAAARPARGALRRRQPRHPARHPHAGAAGRGRPGGEHPLGVGRPRLPGGGPRARVAARSGQDRVHARVRRRGGRGLPSVRAHRRYPPRPRELARAGGDHQARAPRLGKDRIVLVNLSGRGDKDVESVPSGTPRRARAGAGARRDGVAAWPHPAPPGPPQRGGESREDTVVSTPRRSHRGGVRALPTREARRVHPVHHGGRSAARPAARPGARAGRRRRRRHRARRSVQRSDRRRAGQPAGGDARASPAAPPCPASCSGWREMRGELETPLVLFTYFNLIHRRGVERFAEQASASGIDGVLCVDLPPDEAEEETAPIFVRHGIDSDLPAGADVERRPHQERGARVARLRLLRVAHRR